MKEKQASQNSTKSQTFMPNEYQPKKQPTAWEKIITVMCLSVKGIVPKTNDLRNCVEVEFHCTVKYVKTDAQLCMMR